MKEQSWEPASVRLKIKIKLPSSSSRAVRTALPPFFASDSLSLSLSRAREPKLHSRRRRLLARREIASYGKFVPGISARGPKLMSGDGWENCRAYGKIVKRREKRALKVGRRDR